MSAPVRIAFCHHTSDVGGGSDRSLFDLVTHLPRDRFGCLAILRTADPMAEEYRQAGIDVVETPLLHPRKTRRLMPHVRYAAAYGPSVVRVALVIRSFNADIVHVNTMNNLQGPVAARLARRPLVWHIREIGAGRSARAIERMVRGLSTRIVANSNAAGNAFLGCGDRLHIVPNGVDLGPYRNLPTKEVARARLGLEQCGPVALTVGRLEHWKGQHVLIDAIPSVLAQYPKARFLIVGGPAANKPDYMPGLQTRCGQLGITEHVTFTGPRTDIPDILAACNVLVLPSVLPEPFGRTLVEAMAACRPVIATAAGGPLEIVVDGETGILVPPASPDAMGRALCTVFASPELAGRMGERGKARAHELYSLDRLVSDMSALFEDVYRKAGRGTTD